MRGVRPRMMAWQPTVITIGSIYKWMNELGTKLSGTVNMRVTVPPPSATLWSELCKTEWAQLNGCGDQAESKSNW